MNILKNHPVEIVIRRPFSAQAPTFALEQNNELIAKFDLYKLLEELTGVNPQHKHKLGRNCLSSFLDGLAETGFSIDIVHVRPDGSERPAIQYRSNPDLADPLFYVMGFALGRGQLGLLRTLMSACNENKLKILKQTGLTYRSRPHHQEIRLKGLPKKADVS